MENSTGPDPLEENMFAGAEDKQKKLDDIYSYLSLHLENMSPEEMEFWTRLLEEIDPDIEEE